jgi:hypothetical protein
MVMDVISFSSAMSIIKADQVIESSSSSELPIRTPKHHMIYSTPRESFNLLHGLSNISFTVKEGSVRDGTNKNPTLRLQACSRRSNNSIGASIKSRQSSQYQLPFFVVQFRLGVMIEMKIL